MLCQFLCLERIGVEWGGNKRGGEKICTGVMLVITLVFISVLWCIFGDLVLVAYNF